MIKEKQENTGKCMKTTHKPVRASPTNFCFADESPGNQRAKYTWQSACTIQP
jgi:hypothetical protein